MEHETVYISRNALCSGKIVKHCAKITTINGHEYALIGQFKMLRVGHDCHRNEHDAIADATRRRNKKLLSLQGQINNLNRLQFTVS